MTAPHPVAPSERHRSRPSIPFDRLRSAEGNRGGRRGRTEDKVLRRPHVRGGGSDPSGALSSKGTSCQSAGLGPGTPRAGETTATCAEAESSDCTHPRLPHSSHPTRNPLQGTIRPADDRSRGIGRTRCRGPGWTVLGRPDQGVSFLNIVIQLSECVGHEARVSCACWARGGSASGATLGRPAPEESVLRLAGEIHRSSPATEAALLTSVGSKLRRAPWRPAQAKGIRGRSALQIRGGLHGTRSQPNHGSS